MRGAGLKNYRTKDSKPSMKKNQKFAAKGLLSIRERRFGIFRFFSSTTAEKSF